MDLQSYLASIMAVSVAVERVVEILKQLLAPLPIIGWLFTPNSDEKQESLRCASIHFLSAVIGGLIAWLSGITLPQSLASQIKDHGHLYEAFVYALIGLLSASGSAFWNHALDLLKAAKVQKEQTAKAAVVTTNGLPGANAVNL